MLRLLKVQSCTNIYKVLIEFLKQKIFLKLSLLPLYSCRMDIFVVVIWSIGNRSTCQMRCETLFWII